MNKRYLGLGLGVMTFLSTSTGSIFANESVLVNDELSNTAVLTMDYENDEYIIEGEDINVKGSLSPSAELDSSTTGTIATFKSVDKQTLKVKRIDSNSGTVDLNLVNVTAGRTEFTTKKLASGHTWETGKLQGSLKGVNYKLTGKATSKARYKFELKW